MTPSRDVTGTAMTSPPSGNIRPWTVEPITISLPFPFITDSQVLRSSVSTAGSSPSGS